MIVYRIAKHKHARDLSGNGAAAVGGRWNPKGMHVLYTSESRSLAALEFLVHITPDIIAFKIDMLTLEFDVSAGIYEVSIKSLPKGWDKSVLSPALYRYTVDWLKSPDNFIMKVPSSLIHEENNYILNPLHADMANVKVIDIAEFHTVSRFL